MNLGSQDPVILGKSRATLLDEVQRCERLGILYYNIHPGIISSNYYFTILILIIAIFRIQLREREP